MQNIEPGPANGPLTESQRTYALEALHSTQAALHQSLDGVDEAQLTYKPSAERWSIAECVEHIALVESGIFAALRKGLTYPADPAKRAEIRMSDVDVVKAVRSRAITLPAPDAFVPTGMFGNTAASLKAFDQQREVAIEYVATIKEDLRTHYFRHIAFGWLDSYQAILLLSAHVERHRKQIEEVKASSDFPK